MIQTLGRVEENAFVSPEPLMRSLIGFEISQVLMAAHLLGVFSALVEGPRTVADLCRTLGLAEGSGGRLLQTCVALNLLEQKDEKILNSAAVQTYLDPTKATYIGGLLDYYRTDVYAACARLPQAIIENKPQVADEARGVSDIFSAIDHQDDLAARFHQAMHSLGLLEGQRLAGLFPFQKVTRVLDVGGGSGALAISLAKRYPHLKVDIFDRAPVCRQAENYISSAGLGDRLRAVPGDFWADPLPLGSDAILLSMVLHDWSLPEGLQLLKRCAEALPPGGTVLIFEQLLNEDRCGPSITCLTNLIMLLRTRSGSEYTESDYSDLLLKAGFGPPQVVRTPGLRHLLSAQRR